MCGEYPAVGAESNVRLGSPPRVRGVLDFHCDLYRFIGITPACAGSTPRV